MGSPDYYQAEKYDINKEKAKEQWKRLKSHIESHHITVKIVPTIEKYYDSVFLTDTALIINDFAIMSRFHKETRRGEEKLLAEYLKSNYGLRIRHLPEEEGLYYEGGGDTRWSHECGHIWFGYGAGRSTLKGIDAVEKILKEELGTRAPTVHTLRIDDRKTFHLDLAFLPLPNGRALYYPTLSQAAIKQIKSVFGEKNVVKVPTKYFFACNSIAVDEKNIIIPKLPYENYRRWMYEATKMKVDEVNVSEFHLGDGSVQCMSLRWWHI